MQGFGVHTYRLVNATGESHRGRVSYEPNSLGRAPARTRWSGMRIAGNICVLFTANDAYMRDLTLFAPADCIVSNTAADNDHALQQIETVLKGNVAPSTQLRVRKARAARPGQASRRRG